MAGNSPRRRGRPRKPVVAIRRRRGGQPGNRNRWKHGAFSAAARVRRQRDHAAMRAIDFLIAQMLALHACALRATANNLVVEET